MPSTSEIWLTPAPFAQALALREGRLALTPNPRAARSLEVAPLSLQRMAQQLLRLQPETLIDPLSTSQLLVRVATHLGYHDPKGAAGRFTPILSEVLRGGLDLAQLAAFNDPRVQEVARFAGAYVEKLREMRGYAAAETLRLAASHVRERQPVLVTGYPRLGRDEEIFMLAVAGPGSAVVLPFDAGGAYVENHMLTQRFSAAGWTVHQPAAVEAERPLSILGWQFADQEAEVRGVLAHVKALLADGASPMDVAVVARDDAAIGPLVLAIAQEQGVPIHAEYQIPLAQTRFGHWLGMLAEAIEAELPFETTFRLLSHPLCHMLKAEGRALARQTHPAGSKAWIAICPEAAELLWPPQALHLEWVNHLRLLLKQFGIARRARRWASEAIAVGRFERALDQLAARPLEQVSLAEFLGELREITALLTTSAHPSRGGVGLHTPLALFGTRMKHVFVVGAAEDHFPSRLNDDSVLDYATRKRLVAAGFPIESAAAAARRERLTFNAVLGLASASLTLAYPRMAAGKSRMPSPAFGWLGLTPLEPAVPVASVEEGRRIKIFQNGADADLVLTRARLALAVERRREAPGSLSDPNPHDGDTGMPVAWRSRIFSASQLSSLG